MRHLKKIAGWFFFSASAVVLMRIVALNALSYTGHYQWGWDKFWAQMITLLGVAVLLYLWHSLSIRMKLPSELKEEALEEERRAKEWEDNMSSNSTPA